VQNCVSSSFEIAVSCWLRVEQETSAFLSTLN
jgi:hypothetical protein